VITPNDIALFRVTALTCYDHLIPFSHRWYAAFYV